MPAGAITCAAYELLKNGVAGFFPEVGNEEPVMKPPGVQIGSRVRKIVGEALNLDSHEIQPKAALKGDLGAESIDILDILYRLEREFGIRIPRAELFPEAIFQGSPEYVQDGRITDKGLELLRTRLPFADLTDLESHRLVSFVPDLFTVDLLNRYLEWKLNRNAPPSGGPGTVVC
jgi:acyl carrier protein